MSSGKGDTSIGVTLPEGRTGQLDDDSNKRHPMFGVLPTLMAFAMAAPIESKRKKHAIGVAPAIQLPSILRPSRAAVDDRTLQDNSETKKDKQTHILNFDLKENIKTFTAEGILRNKSWCDAIHGGRASH